MKNQTNRKSNYLKQGTILVVASFIARAIGMIYRIPLTNILGDLGNSYYSTANAIYSIILMISSFSLPLAVSRLVAERRYRGEYRNVQRVFICSLKFALISGGALSLLTLLLSKVICKYIMEVEMAWYALSVLAPAIFIFALVGVLRGFFQGHETMVPTAVSQIIEQVVNAFVTVICAGILMNYGIQLGKENGESRMGAALGAAGGTFGTVASVSIALIFMFVIYLSYRKHFKRQLSMDRSGYQESDQAIFRALSMTILPVILSTLLYNISTIIDQGIYNHVMKGMEYSSLQYNTVWGIYSGKFQVLMNVPLSIASCLAPSVVPALTAAMEEGDFREAGIKTRDSIRYTMIITIPCAVGMAALAKPVMQLLFGNNESLNMAAGLLQAGALLIVLLSLSTLTTGILQGLGDMKAPVRHSAIALVIHIGFLFFFLYAFDLNIYAVLYANIVFAFLMCIMNGYSIRRNLRYRQEIRRTFIIPIICSGIMGLAAYLVYRLFDLFAPNVISTIFGILTGVIVYAITLVKLRGITEKELYRMPKGELMVVILYKLHIL